MRSTDAGRGVLRCERAALLFAAASLLAVGVMGAALWKTLPPPGPAQLQDLRTDRTKHRFTIVVNVRDAGAHGHAWVTWFRHVSNEDHTTSSFGYFARLNGTGYDEMLDAAGELRDELNCPRIRGQDTRLAMVFWLDEDQFDRSFSAVARWQGSSRYRLFSRDCVTFVADVLGTIGVDLPKRVMAPSPRQYLVALSELQLWRRVPHPR